MSRTMRLKTRNSLIIMGMLIGLLLPAVPVSSLTSSSLSLSDPRTSQTNVTYTFDAQSYTTGTAVACINILLNDASDGSGNAVGTSTGASLVSSSVITEASWTLDASSNGTLNLTHNATNETPNATGNFVFDGITNGGTAGATYYAIFTSYTDSSCTGGNEVDEQVVAFTYKDGELVQLTIDPTLTFTCAAVASGQTVNGATTTVASTALGINHGNAVTFSTNGISAHDLNVSTNATNGYTVSIRHTGQLSNGSDTIANFSGGDNTTPDAFSAAGTEGWGYTTEDATLSGGTANRFTSPANQWAGFTTSNEPVVDNTSGTSGTETTRVGHQVGVATTTPAGTYQTTIIYTVASTY